MTAVQSIQGMCTFGLAVSSASDPIVSEDHLPGPGIYGAVISGQGISACSADSAPTTGWFPVDRAILRRMQVAS